MSAHDDDRDVRAAFEALRDHDRGRTPALDGILEARPPHRAIGSRWILASAVAAAAVGALLLRPAAPGGEISLEEAIVMAEVISSWTAPSDAFGDISGAGILEGIPDLDMTSLSLPEPTEELP